jgi:hypothetical protein
MKINNWIKGIQIGVELNEVVQRTSLPNNEVIAPERGGESGRRRPAFLKQNDLECESVSV